MLLIPKSNVFPVLCFALIALLLRPMLLCTIRDKDSSLSFLDLFPQNISKTILICVKVLNKKTEKKNQLDLKSSLKIVMSVFVH